jgi:transposase-like protein
VTETCPQCGNDVPAKTIGYEVRGVYDGVLFWICAECNTAYQRWGHQDRLHDVARPYIEEHNRKVTW